MREKPLEVMLRVWIATVVAFCALAPACASAKPAAIIDAGIVAFFSDSLGVIARNGTTVALGNGLHITGDTAYVDLRADRAVIAGDVRMRRGSAVVHADAVAFDLPGKRIDIERAESGITRTDAAFAAEVAAPGDGSAFTFPDLDDKRAYILARHAEVTSKTSVRFRPARFPTSAGAPPVPLYLYTFASSNGFAATALPGATFDQPYGLYASPNALTALHVRLIDGEGPALGIQQTLIDNNNGYLAGALDAPVHAPLSELLNSYRQLGDAGTVTVSGSSTADFRQAGVGFTQAIGSLLGRLNYGIQSNDFSSALASLRTRDKVLFSGITWHASATFGYQAWGNGMLVPQALDAPSYSTIWQHGLDVFVASPLVRLPLGTTIAATLDASRTDYSYPHHFNALELATTASRRLTRTLTLFAGYDARWSGDIYPNEQSVFYTPVAVPFGPSGYRGFGTSRLSNLDLQYVQGASTSLRLSYRRADDFPQFDGFGRPPNEVRLDVRIRPFTNIGLAFGRSYDFGWNGTHWVPGWNFAILP